MKSARSSNVLPVIAGFLLLAGLGTALSSHAAEVKPDRYYFSGWLVEMNPATRTFAVRSGRKVLQFTTDLRRTSITVDGRFSLQQSLRSARVGDAVMGRVSFKRSKPYLGWVTFTHKPAYGRKLQSKPGFVLSPYNLSAQFDVRKSARGDMVLDNLTEKIFLVP